MPLGTQSFLVLILIAAAGIVGYQWRGPLGLIGCMLAPWLVMSLLSSPWREWHWRR